MAAAADEVSVVGAVVAVASWFAAVAVVEGMATVEAMATGAAPAAFSTQSMAGLFVTSARQVDTSGMIMLMRA